MNPKDELDTLIDSNVIGYFEDIRGTPKHPCVVPDLWVSDQIAWEIVESLAEVHGWSGEKERETHLHHVVNSDDPLGEDWGLGDMVESHQFVVVGRGSQRPRYLVTVEPYTPEQAKADVDRCRAEMQRLIEEEQSG